LLERAKASKNVGVTDKIASIAIPTRERVPLVLRAVDSYGAYLASSHQSVSLIIADGSMSATGRRDIINALRSSVNRYGYECLYIGAEEKERFVVELSGLGLPTNIARFALFGDSALSGITTLGSNRNAIQLQTLGSKVLCVDDDTLCLGGSISSVDSGLRIRGHGDVTEAWFFSTRAAAVHGVNSLKSVDILACHDTMLGRSLTSLILAAEPRQGANVREGCGHIVSSLIEGQAFVATTYNGLVGDSATYSSLEWPMHPSSETRWRWYRAIANGPRAQQVTREVIRQVTAPTICHGGLSIGAFIGLDNRRLLPPFMPLFRNSDGVFGAILARLDGHYCAHLPISLLHAPPSSTLEWARQHPAANLKSWTPGLRVSEILAACISTWRVTLPAISADAKLKSLGQFLINLGSLETAAFQNVVRTALLTTASRYALQIEHLISQNGDLEPAWKPELRRRLDELRRSVEETAYYHPLDVDHGSPEKVTALKEFVHSFGMLLNWWPHFVEATRFLRQRDRQLGIRIS
jgi:hypothetical protein